ncbi:MAG TPA: YncE family protein [Blastocatellia bacterium]|nr:YncE family protein [Blastocatellia bacterium]
MLSQYTVVLSLLVWGCITPARTLPLRGAPQAPHALLYVANSQGNDITIIDASTFKVAGNIVVGKNPHGLAPSPDGSRIFATVEGEDELIAIDTASNKIVGRTKVGKRPNEPTVTADGRWVYVPLLADSAVDVVDTASLKVVAHIPVPAMPHNTYSSADGKYVYLGSMSGSKITVIDTASKSVLREISPGGWVRPMAIRKDNSIAYVAISGLHGFVVVDLTSGQALKQVHLPELPEGTPKPYLDTYTHGLALNPDESKLYVTSVPGNALYEFALPGFEQRAKIAVGRDPNWIAVRSDGRYLFVSNTSSDSVSVIDAKTDQVVATVPTGHAPKRVALVQHPEPDAER